MSDETRPAPTPLQVAGAKALASSDEPPQASGQKVGQNQPADEREAAKNRLIARFCFGCVVGYAISLYVLAFKIVWDLL